MQHREHWVVVICLEPCIQRPPPRRNVHRYVHASGFGRPYVIIMLSDQNLKTPHHLQGSKSYDHTLPIGLGCCPLLVHPIKPLFVTVTLRFLGHLSGIFPTLASCNGHRASTSRYRMVDTRASHQGSRDVCTYARAFEDSRGSLCCSCPYLDVHMYANHACAHSEQCIM